LGRLGILVVEERVLLQVLLALLVLFGLPFCCFLLLSERVDFGQLELKIFRAQSRGSVIRGGVAVES
jgi:hypothetical protein